MEQNKTVRLEGISIHALRGEGDLQPGDTVTVRVLFQSTPSAGRATISSESDSTLNIISIHALRGEGDRRKIPIHRPIFRFQSTPSAGRATVIVKKTGATDEFQSTPSAGRATAKMHKFCLQFSFNLQISLKPTHFKSIIKYFYAHFCKKHDMFPVRKPAGIDVSMNFALKH